MTTARSFIAASAVSQSSPWLPSMTRTRSSARTPHSRSLLATRFERSAISAKDSRVTVPSSSTMCSAVRSFPSAMTSNQSSAQLKYAGRGHRKPEYAAS